MRSLAVLLFSFFSMLSFGQIIDFPDPNFKEAILNSNTIDTDGNGYPDIGADENNDGEIDLNEASQINYLFINNKGIESLDGIENFVNLEYLTCGRNLFDTLDVSHMPSLRRVNCVGGGLKSINVAGLPLLNQLIVNNNNLTKLVVEDLANINRIDCFQNNLTELVVSDLPNLNILDCWFNDISELNLNSIPKLEYLNCSRNNISELSLENVESLNDLNCSMNNIYSLDVDGHPSLYRLNCGNNNLTELVFSEKTDLLSLDCRNNEIKELDISVLTNLDRLYCSQNDIRSLNIKNGNDFFFMSLVFDDNPQLEYICCSEHYVDWVTSRLHFLGQTHVAVNTYCSFTPGGDFHTLSGVIQYDSNNDGCSQTDIRLPYAKLNISSTQDELSGNLITNSSGEYNIALQAGNYKIKPYIKNGELFEFNPEFIFFSPSEGSEPMIQNFCMSPKLIFSNIEISIIPLAPPARPGFNTGYKIIFENKGTVIEDGLLEFRYYESVLDYVSASQEPDIVADGFLGWEFSGLFPFEKREVIVTLNVNSPTDNPPVEIGDELIFGASIDNVEFRLSNIVVGAYDPNNKTCLQGGCVTEEMIGDYVDYLIRFENTGDYPAENVVIKDVIDTLTYDITSLEIIDASHEMYTRIRGDVVEFIFENIQLPFDDETNDGYVAFQIKTNPTLTIGDSLNNVADIYFDFNHPIRTNNAKSHIIDEAITPPPTACYESAVYNTITCEWVVSGSFITAEPEDYITIESASDLESNIQDWLDNNGGAQASQNCGTITWSHDYTYDYSPGNHWVRFVATTEDGLMSEELIALLSIQTASSIESSQNSQTILLSPNPVKSSVTLENIESFKRVTVLQNDGKVILSQDIDSNKITLSLENLISGIYFLEFSKSDGERTLEKLIKY